MDRNDVLRLLSTPVNAPAAPGPYRSPTPNASASRTAPTRQRPAASFPIHSRSASRWCGSLDPVAPQIPRHDH
jgi:hypothetical protein